MKIIGLTGGIGSGKSTVTEFFVQLGVPIIDADSISHQLVAKGMPALEQIKAVFGDTVIDDRGNLNRTKMRALVFSSETSENAYKKKLESILHPLIYKKIKIEIYKLKNSIPPPSYCLVVIPLLIEHWAQFKELIDEIVVVDTPVSLQLKRIQQRDNIAKNLTDEQALAIIHNQTTRDNRLLKAQTVISNTGNLTALKEQIHRLNKLWRYL